MSLLTKPAKTLRLRKRMVITMKKILALIACAALCLSLAACSKLTLEDYLKENEAALSEQYKSLEGSGVEVSITARGTALVYTFQYTVDLPQDAATTKAKLDAVIDAQESDMTKALKDIKKEVDGVESIILEYVNKNGSVITSKEFK